MKKRLVRLGLVGSLAVAVSAPMTAPANAWACLDDVTRLLCFVAGTSCRTVGEVTGSSEWCQLG